MATMIPNRVVIDTNVCLDLFVFRDPRYAELLGALRVGSLKAVTNAACRKEWIFVLGYPHLPLGESDKPAVIAEFDGLIGLMEIDEPEERTLPVCRDKEDQKFLELARDTHAEFLITKDKALLKLAKRTAKLGLYTILTPDDWLRRRQN